MHLQPNVKSELEKLSNEGFIEKLLNCSNQIFISAIVITVKKDQSINIALNKCFEQINTQKQVPNANYPFTKSNNFLKN